MIVFEVSIKFWFRERIIENTISYLYFKGAIISELQNRVTHYDVTNRVTNSKIFLFFYFSS